MTTTKILREKDQRFGKFVHFEMAIQIWLHYHNPDVESLSLLLARPRVLEVLAKVYPAYVLPLLSVISVSGIRHISMIQ